jgi:hypothetical protein
VSSSRKPAKRPSGAKAAGRRTTARRPTSTKVNARGAKRPAAKKSQPARAAKPQAPTKSLAAAPPPSRPTPAARQSFRLAGSASSRLTIKPGTATASRAQLELSTKRRPAGPRRLSEVELDEDEVLIDGFDAMLEGVKVRITAVLERTCVYVDRGGDRRLARKIDLWVEANKLPIRRRSFG